MPPAVSIPVQRIREVHPGADPVKRVAGYVLHTLHAVSEISNYLIRVEPRINFVSCLRRSFLFCMEVPGILLQDKKPSGRARDVHFVLLQGVENGYNILH